MKVLVSLSSLLVDNGCYDVDIYTEGWKKKLAKFSTPRDIVGLLKTVVENIVAIEVKQNIVIDEIIVNAYIDPFVKNEYNTNALINALQIEKALVTGNLGSVNLKTVNAYTDYICKLMTITVNNILESKYNITEKMKLLDKITENIRKYTITINKIDEIIQVAKNIEIREDTTPVIHLNNGWDLVYSTWKDIKLFIDFVRKHYDIDHVKTHIVKWAITTFKEIIETGWTNEQRFTEFITNAPEEIVEELVKRIDGMEVISYNPGFEKRNGEIYTYKYKIRLNIKTRQDLLNAVENIHSVAKKVEKVEIKKYCNAYELIEVIPRFYDKIELIANNIFSIKHNKVTLHFNVQPIMQEDNNIFSKVSIDYSKNYIIGIKELSVVDESSIVTRNIEFYTVYNGVLYEIIDQEKIKAIYNIHNSLYYTDYYVVINVENIKATMDYENEYMTNGNYATYYKIYPEEAITAVEDFLRLFLISDCKIYVARSGDTIGVVTQPS